MDFSAVPSLLERATRSFILPRFARLAPSQIEEKTPGELVTIADREAEAFLSSELKKLCPGSEVVGEEACASNPGLIQSLNAQRCWVIDPLDGTGNFISGQSQFGTLLAYLEHGQCLRSWLYRSVSGLCFSADSLGGASVDGQPLRVSAADRTRLRGIVKTRFLPPQLKETVVARASAGLSAVLPGANCTAFDYPDIVRGEVDFALYWRTLAWDHIPCVHFLEAAGGVARRIDGSRYDATEAREGLLVARDEVTWQQARAILFE
jgi:fructose-1,6-bisphosphatase/inositol monophosphatase family enzyme